MSVINYLRNAQISTRYVFALSKRITHFHENKLTPLSSSVSESNVFRKEELPLINRRTYCTKDQIQNANLKQNKEGRDFKIVKYVTGFMGACLLAAFGARQFWKRKCNTVVKEREPVKKGLYYGEYMLPSFALDVIDRIPSFEVREDDIWIMGFPKSGTTWLQEVVYLIAHDADFDSAKSSIEDRVPFLEFTHPGIRVIGKMPSPRYMKTHLAFSVLPNDYKKVKPKTIYIARNPKDVVVSFYLYLAKFFKGDKVTLTMPFEEYCQLFADGEVIYGPWVKHVKEGWEKRNDENVLFITYEDMNMDLTGSIKKIASFMGKKLSDKDIEAIASYCSFEKMRHNKFVNKEWYKERGMANKDAYYLRKGKVGDWKNHLSKETTARLDEIVKTELEPLGMTFKDSSSTEDEK